MRSRYLDKLYAVITLIICILFLGGLGGYALWADKAIAGIEIVLTGLVTIITTIIGYLWGSSVKSNHDEDTKDG